MSVPNEERVGQFAVQDAFSHSHVKAVFGFAGASGAGKTTLLTKIAGILQADGYSVSAVKHTRHRTEFDQPGKDSFRMREAGCREVILAGEKRWALMHECRDGLEPSMDQILARMAPVDIVLVEGFHAASMPKIEVFRPSLGQAPLWRSHPSIVAVATDESIACERIVLDLNNASTIADFIIACLSSPNAD